MVQFIYQQRQLYHGEYFMTTLEPTIRQVPSLFQYLSNQKLIAENHILSAGDGFFMIRKSLADILGQRGIDAFPDKEGRILECGNYFDDWFLYAVSGESGPVYGLLKMREQEFDLEDGDTPGVTVSFISFCIDRLKDCLEDPSPENRRNLGIEINRVVAYPKQYHHPALKAYFIRPQAEAPYLIAETYARHIASFSKNGVLEVPAAYTEIYQKRSRSSRYSRIPDFLEQNNRYAGTQICNHQKIFLRDPDHLSTHEKLAILATHTGNTSFHSFAAEIRYHAMFLVPSAKVRLPFLGSPYASAVRADMSIGDKEFQWPTPYYNLSGKLVLMQAKYHP